MWGDMRMWVVLLCGSSLGINGVGNRTDIPDYLADPDGFLAKLVKSDFLKSDIQHLSRIMPEVYRIDYLNRLRKLDPEYATFAQKAFESKTGRLYSGFRKRKAKTVEEYNTDAEAFSRTYKKGVIKKWIKHLGIAVVRSIVTKLGGEALKEFAELENQMRRTRLEYYKIDKERYGTVEAALKNKNGQNFQQIRRMLNADSHEKFISQLGSKDKQHALEASERVLNMRLQEANRLSGRSRSRRLQRKNRAKEWFNNLPNENIEAIVLCQQQAENINNLSLAELRSIVEQFGDENPEFTKAVQNVYNRKQNNRTKQREIQTKLREERGSVSAQPTETNMPEERQKKLREDRGPVSAQPKETPEAAILLSGHSDAVSAEAVLNRTVHNPTHSTGHRSTTAQHSAPGEQQYEANKSPPAPPKPRKRPSELCAPEQQVKKHRMSPQTSEQPQNDPKRPMAAYCNTYWKKWLIPANSNTEATGDT